MEMLISKIANQGAYGLLGIIFVGSINAYVCQKLYNGVKTELYRRGETAESLHTQFEPLLNIISSANSQIESI